MLGLERLLQSNYHPASEITPSATYFPIRPAHSTRWPLLLCPFPASIFLHLPIDFLFADFVISSFFSGVGGALFAMFANNAQAKVYTSTMTYEILLIVVIGGIGSISGSVLSTFLYVACSEWWLRGLDMGSFLGIKLGLFRNGFRMVVFSVVIMIVVLFFRQGIMGNKEITDLLKPRKKTKEVAK